MKRPALIAALALLTSPTFAADMSQPVYATKAPLMAAPVAGTWQGFYIGLDGGYGWGGTSIDPLVTTTGLGGVPIVNPFANPAPSGFLFGGHGGYNWQYGNVVGGLEVDYLGADMTDSQTVALNKAATINGTLATKIDSLASGRAKLGYALNDIILLYGTGGIAWGHESATASVTFPTSRTATGSISETTAANQFGWVAGAGAEMKILTNVLLRAQFLHYDFGDVAYTLPIGFGGVTGANAKTTVNAITGGISYKF
jgi:outer membrane immunogenic protein